MNTLASLRLNWSYSFLESFPGSAISIRLEYLPTLSGNMLIVGCFNRAMFVVVDRIAGNCFCDVPPCFVVFRASSFAFRNSSFSLFNRIHCMVTVFFRSRRFNVAGRAVLLHFVVAVKHDTIASGEEPLVDNIVRSLSKI